MISAKLENGLVQPMSTRIAVALAVVLCLAWSAAMFSLWQPGAMSADSFAILKQARAGQFSDSWPPIFGIIWGWLDGFVAGPALMLIIQLIMFSLGAALVITSSSNSWLLSFILFLIFGFFPPLIGIIGVVWLDIYMAACLLMAVGLGLLAVRIGSWAKGWLLATALIFVFLAVASRHNAAAAAVPISGWLVYCLSSARHSPFRRFAFSLVSGGCISITLFAVAGLLNSTVVDTRAHFWTVLLQYDLAGIAVREPDGKVQIEILQPQTVADIRTLYTPRSVLPLMWGRQVHEEEYGRPSATATPLPEERFRSSADARSMLLREWRSAIVRSPRAYLTHRARVFGSLVGLPPFGDLWGPIFTQINENDLSIEPRPAQTDKPVFRILSLLSHTILFKPYLYLILCTVLLAWSLTWFIRTGARSIALAVFVLSSGLLHSTGLFFVVVSSDFRYSHWTIVTTVLGGVILFLKAAQGRSTRQSTPVRN